MVARRMRHRSRLGLLATKVMARPGAGRAHFLQIQLLLQRMEDAVMN